jgi:predicted transposase YbfD/YdcC
MVVYTSEKDEEKVQEKRYFLYSIGNDVKKFSQAIRKHWGIESMYWSLDVTFNEDAKRVKKDRAPENLAILHRLALNIMKMDKSKKTSLKKKRRIHSF